MHAQYLSGGKTISRFLRSSFRSTTRLSVSQHASQQLPSSMGPSQCVKLPTRDSTRLSSKSHTFNDLSKDRNDAQHCARMCHSRNYPNILRGRYVLRAISVSLTFNCLPNATLINSKGFVEALGEHFARRRSSRIDVVFSEAPAQSCNDSFDSC